MAVPGTPPPNPLRIDPATGLPLPDPFPEYVVCPHCGEAEVEAWCYQEEVVCHNCGRTLAHVRPPGCGTFPFCKRGVAQDDGR
jgi:hypothetical protein